MNDLRLTSGKIGRPVAAIGLHVQVVIKQEDLGCCETRMILDSDCEDQAAFWRTWTELGGQPLVTEDGDPIEVC